jgi:hypothetical protein
MMKFHGTFGKHPNGWPRYVAATCLYGAMRKVPYTWDATVTPFNAVECRRKRMPMLVTSKVVVIALGGILGPFLWPMHTIADAGMLDIWLSGYRPHEYGHEQGRHIFDYILK